MARLEQLKGVGSAHDVSASGVDGFRLGGRNDGIAFGWGSVFFPQLVMPDLIWHPLASTPLYSAPDRGFLPSVARAEQLTKSGGTIDTYAFGADGFRLRGRNDVGGFGGV